MNDPSVELIRGVIRREIVNEGFGLPVCQACFSRINKQRELMALKQMGSNCARTFDVTPWTGTQQQRPESRAIDNATWHAMNTGYINSTKETSSSYTLFVIIIPVTPIVGWLLTPFVYWFHCVDAFVWMWFTVLSSCHPGTYSLSFHSPSPKYACTRTRTCTTPLMYLWPRWTSHMIVCKVMVKVT